MMRVLDLGRWERGWITYKKTRFPVLFMPGTRRKLALLWKRGEKKVIFWHDLTRTLWRKVNDLYALRRMLRHIQLQYDGVEIPQLVRILSTIRGVDVELGVLPTMADDVRTALREAVGDIVVELEWVQDPWKQDALDQLEWVLPLVDSHGRRNIAVLRTRSRTARERLELRVQEILGIHAAVARYLGIVRQLVWALEYLTNEAKTRITKLRDHPRVHYIYIHELTVIRGDVAQLVLPPYQFVARAVGAELTRAIEASERGRFDDVRHLIRRAWEGLEMKSVRGTLEWTLFRLIAENGESAVALRSLIPDVARSFNRLSPRLITENGFQYPGKRDAARKHLTAAIAALRDGSRENAKTALKQAASVL